MKKLMTIFASAATLCAVGVAKGELTTTGFEAAPYVAGQALDTAKDDAGRTSVDGAFAATWVATELEDGVAVISNWNGETIPQSYDKAIGKNYLKLDSAPLISRYAQEGGTALEIGDGLYIDTLVQFTAADPETPPETNAGDKLCVWLAENTVDSTQCTLMIGAGFVDDFYGAIVPTNYETNVKLANNSWHRLQVKVLPAIDSDQAVDAALSDGFVVLIDGVVVATATCPFYDESAFTLNPRAARYMTTGSYQLFPSLVAKYGAGEGTITSLSFSGSGAVDNIEFTQAADIDPILVTIPTAKVGLIADGTKQTGVTYDENLECEAFELDGDAPAQTDAGEYTTTFKLFAGYAWIGGSTADYNVEWSIASGSGTGGFDGGDGSAFSIDAATQSALETVLPAGKKLTDTADAASGMTYAQAYALGLLDDKTGDVEPLEATIEFVDGKVKVSLNDATATAKYVVTLKVYEKSSLTAAWPTTPKLSYELGSSAEAAGFAPGSETAGFYKVQVVIGDGTSN